MLQRLCSLVSIFLKFFSQIVSVPYDCIKKIDERPDPKMGYVGTYIPRDRFVLHLKLGKSY